MDAKDISSLVKWNNNQSKDIIDYSVEHCIKNVLEKIKQIFSCGKWGAWRNTQRFAFRILDIDISEYVIKIGEILDFDYYKQVVEDDNMRQIYTIQEVLKRFILIDDVFGGAFFDSIEEYMPLIEAFEKRGFKLYVDFTEDWNGTIIVMVNINDN